MRTAHDYAWIRSAFPNWFSDGYCCALVRADVSDVIDGLGGARHRLPAQGLGAGEALGAFAPNLDLDVDLENEQAFGVAAVAGDGGGWALIVQSQSTFLGIVETPMIEVLGERFEVVAHAHGNGYGQFTWWRAGVRQVQFEPMLAPHHLSSQVAPWAGPGRDRVVELIGETGGIHVEPAEHPSSLFIEGAFALADALTGVQLTRDILAGNVFELIVVGLRYDRRWDR